MVHLSGARMLDMVTSTNPTSTADDDVRPLLPLLLVDLLHRPQLLLQLHPPVLEPDLDLPLRQAQRMGNLDPPSPSKVMVEVELLLQLQGLETRVGLSSSPPRTTIGTLETIEYEKCIDTCSVHNPQLF